MPTIKVKEELSKLKLTKFSDTGILENAETGANVGGGAEVFRDKVGNVLNFRTLTGTSGIVASENGDVIEIDGSGVTATPAPGGSDQQVQFNDSSVLAGSSGVLYDKTLNRLTVTAEFSSPTASASSVKLGIGASAGSQSTAVGETATAVNSASAFGYSADATGTSSASFGRQSEASGSSTAAFGASAQARSNNSTSIGALAVVNTNSINSTVVGDDTQIRSNCQDAIAIGHSADIGQTTAGGSSNAIAIGSSSIVNNGSPDTIVIGKSSTGAHGNSTAIGTNAQTTATDRCTIGTIGGANDQELQVGKGVAAFGVTPPASQPAKISDVTATAGGTYTATEQAMINDLKAKLNAIIDVMEGAGLSSAV